MENNQDNHKFTTERTQPQPQPIPVKNLSADAYRMLLEQRSRITYGGRYQDRYQHEFDSSRKSQEKQVTKNTATENRINQSKDLRSFKLVQNVSREENWKRKVELPQENFQQRPPTNCIDLRPLQNRSGNQQPNMSSSDSKTPDSQISKQTSEERLSSIDPLSAIEATINSMETRTLKNKNDTMEFLSPKPNMYGEHLNLIKPGISDLASEDGFNQGLNPTATTRNSTGGVEQLNQEKQIIQKVKLNRTASDTQDRPVPRLTRKTILNNRNNIQMTKKVLRTLFDFEGIIMYFWNDL